MGATGVDKIAALTACFVKATAKVLSKSLLVILNLPSIGVGPGIGVWLGGPSVLECPFAV